MGKIFFFVLLFGFFLVTVSGCAKEKELINGPLIFFRGKLVDDKSGQPVSGGSIKVSGYYSEGGVWFGYSEEKILGEAIIDAAGNFSLGFKKWDAAQEFRFSFSTIPGYFYRYFSLKSTEAKSTDTTLKITKITNLKIHFKNAAPVDSNDRISFGIMQTETNYGWFPENPSTTLFSGYYSSLNLGYMGNAEGNEIYTVGADRKYLINYTVKKNNIVTTYKDSVFCFRDVMNVFNLNY